MLEIYYWSVLITAIFFTSFGFFAFVNQPKALQNRLFGLLSLSFAIWSYSWFFMLTTKDEAMAIFLAKLLNLGATVIPVFFLHWIMVVLEKDKNNRYLILFSYLVTLIFASLSFTNLYISGVKSISFFPYWPVAGPLYAYFLLICYGGFIGLALFLLIKGYFRVHAEKKHQIAYILAGALLGFGGGATNFPVMYGYGEIMPWGVFFVMASPFVLSYGAVRYRLLNIKVIATELFSGVISLVFLINLLTAESAGERFVAGLLLFLAVIYSLSLVHSVYKEIETREKIELLAKKLETANERLRFLDKQKSEFVSIASHQLRSPLTAIKGYSSMLLEGSFGVVETKAREAVKRVLQSSEHLVNLVEDLLNVSRLEQGRMKYIFKVVDLEAMTSEIINSLMPNAEIKKLKVEFKTDHKPPYHVRADEEKIRQVVMNLVDNAIKYTPKGFVHVELEKTDRGKKVLLSISDSGVGISRELISRLFEKFTRGEGESQKLHVNGTGLGLYVAREMIKSHGGRIWAESPGEGKGSTFYIEIKEAGEAMYESRVNRLAETL